MQTSHSNYTGRMARSLTEAFGAHTSTHIYPLGSDKKPIRRGPRMSQALWSYAVAAVVVGLASLTVVVR
jgi:hypothetical protein